MIRIVVFTDAHYARGRVFNGTRQSGRSLEKIKSIFKAMPPADAVIDLGDLVNATGDAAEDDRNIAEALALTDGSGIPCMHVLGNHDCEAAPKARYTEKPYYRFDIGGVSFFALDGNYISTGESYDTADWDWKDAYITPEQTKWLRKGLGDADRAVVLCHQDLDDRPGDPHVIGNAAEVRDVLEQAGNVLCVLQGHCHSGAFTRSNGIDYHTFRALCEGDGIPYAVVTIDGEKAMVEAFDLAGK